MVIERQIEINSKCIRRIKETLLSKVVTFIAIMRLVIKKTVFPTLNNFEKPVTLGPITPHKHKTIEQVYLIIFNELKVVTNESKL